MMAVGMKRPLASPWADGLVRLYQEWYGPMVRLAYLLTSDRLAAEELVQDAFVSVHRSGSGWTRHPPTCGSWW